MKTKLSSQEILLLTLSICHTFIGVMYVSLYMEFAKTIYMAIVILSFLNGALCMCNFIASIKKKRVKS